LLIATNNPGKLLEVIGLLGGLPLEVMRPIDLGLDIAVDEYGSTYAENATLKARAFAAAAGIPALADDSGIELVAFGDWPGVHSVRFAGPTATDAERRELILDRLAARQPEQRRARFVCAMALADEHAVIARSRGVLNGTIARSVRGTTGFGYDPIFIPNGYYATLAELPAPAKDRISHRARALANLRQAIERRATQSPPPLAGS
jgi:XTP/dITP diphosphohydrolase